MKQIKKWLPLTLVAVMVMAVALPGLAEVWSHRYGDEELYTNSGYYRHIKNLQTDLNSYFGYNRLTVDGYFGQKTKAAVMDFQQDKGLTVDGRVGPATKTALWNHLF